jgi:excisionase family DNA binding protein
MSPFLDTTQAAAQLHLSPWTVRRWARAGRLPSVKLGRKVLFLEAALAAVITAATRPAAPPTGETRSAS